MEVPVEPPRCVDAPGTKGNHLGRVSPDRVPGPSGWPRWADRFGSQWRVIVNVTTLGSGVGEVGRSVGNIVNYLEGRSPDADLGRSRPGSAAQPLEPQGPGPGAYYADSGEGRWIGKGTEGAGFALSGTVESEQLKRLLLGADPNTGERLMHNRGVSARTNPGTDPGPDGRVRSVSPGHSGAGASQGALVTGQGASPGALRIG